MEVELLIDISTILSGLSTVAIAVLTVFLWRENRLLRKAGSEPKLVAYFEPHPDGTGGLNISVANVGTGPARDVYIQFKGEESDFTNYDLILDCTEKRGPLTLIPQGEKISVLFAIGYQLFKPKNGNERKPLPPFSVALEWKNLDGKAVFRDEYKLDVKPYGSLPGFVNKPYLLKIVNSIDGVSKSVSRLNKDVTCLANIIEANRLEEPWVQKHRGNSD
ncbi:TPA: hypothetical protein I7141_22775 [Vibrio vulnificus]|uniref:hypothetical protein n=1 Tax=Vibrio TaxID=662 RepID=UPI000CE964F2|nr:hypothetical protein [Vibrio alginolyticus]EKO3865964.1 hypothetical protein [Vibrio harveyi]MCU8317666.1 hypothetical protein [Vibrio vulnificus]AVF66078.1 hypothetical protein AL541_17875 [Vibrio alginolyticus]HAS6078679.1 hypothetical protein [Vibrio vulnificus]HAS6222116.1 hypothetical protein [Vibrio vulnificus]